ncbi:hypothetical protein TNCV_4254141 [Trichonephila clavipes]|nr:hypothetical protein TNCV_4254141 [Trichonephila clavipes]
MVRGFKILLPIKFLPPSNSQSENFTKNFLNIHRILLTQTKQISLLLKGSLITPRNSKRGSQLQTSTVKEQTALDPASFSRSLDARIRQQDEVEVTDGSRQRRVVVRCCSSRSSWCKAGTLTWCSICKHTNRLLKSRSCGKRHTPDSSSIVFSVGIDSPFRRPPQRGKRLSNRMLMTETLPLLD